MMTSSRAASSCRYRARGGGVGADRVGVWSSRVSPALGKRLPPGARSCSCPWRRQWLVGAAAPPVSASAVSCCVPSRGDDRPAAAFSPALPDPRTALRCIPRRASPELREPPPCPGCPHTGPVPLLGGEPSPIDSRLWKCTELLNTCLSSKLLLPQVSKTSRDSVGPSRGPSAGQLTAGRPSGARSLESAFAAWRVLQSLQRASPGRAPLSLTARGRCERREGFQWNLEFGETVSDFFPRENDGTAGA